MTGDYDRCLQKAQIDAWEELWTAETRYGWLCPRCNRVNAPDVKECQCKPEVDWKEALRNRGISPDSTGQPPFEIGEGGTDGVPIKYQVWS